MTVIDSEERVMSSQPAIPQTLTAMEAGFKLRPGVEEEFGRMNVKSIGIAAEQPGFVSVCGGPIVNSSWLSFLVKFRSPDAMNDWHHHAKHRPVQNLAKTRWFSAYYIRKWRLPAEGEPLGEWIYCETEIAPDQPLDANQLSALQSELNATLNHLDAPPFETLTGEFESQPYQLTGPLESAPQSKPVQYLLLTHWTSPSTLEKWFTSPGYQACQQLGEVTSTVFVPIKEEPGDRFALRDDGLQRDWSLKEEAAGSTTG